MKHPAKTACGACCTLLEGLSVTLEGVRILEDVNLHLHCGELTAIIGPNGAGKTTLFHALLGLTPHRGRIAFTDARDGQRRVPRIGYVPQTLVIERMAPITVLDFLLASRTRRPIFMPPAHGHLEAVRQSLEAVGAAELLTRRMGALSGGEIQRVLLALALWPTPDLLLLDEPVSGVDADGMRLFYGAVDGLRRRYDMSVLLITHNFGMVRRYADRAVLLDRTVLDQGDPGAVLTGAAFRAAFPGLTVVEDANGSLD